MDGDLKAASDIKETDIIFDCPHCGKSLAIDYRGAGLSIKCSDCGNDVQVPIPDGMELEDIDSTNEEQEVLVMHLRKCLNAAQERIELLESAVQELTARRESLEKGRSESMYHMVQVVEKMSLIEESLKTVSSAVSDVATICGRDDE